MFRPSLDAATLPYANVSTFRNLPLTPEQDARLKARIAEREATGEDLQTLELAYMLQDMLSANGALTETIRNAVAADRSKR